MKGIDSVIAFDPEYIRSSALLASFEYPAVADQELLRGWANVPVWPQLWEYVATAKTKFPPPDNMVEFLLKLTDEEDDGIEFRAQKLVMDFIREIHAYALLVRFGGFNYVNYQRILDLQYNIDFEVLPKGLEDPVGIQTAMRRVWGQDVWRQLHAERRRRRGAKDWQGPIFWMTNRRIAADELSNKLWLFRTCHVEEVMWEIKGQLKEFNSRFLLATRPYLPELAKRLLRECREDVELFGWEHAMKKWGKFVESPKEGACPICGSTDWWWRQNNWAPKGEWLCNVCHPNPNKEAEMSTNKGKCKHGEFILTEGCPQCMAEKQAGEAGEADKAEEMNQQGEPELAAIEDEGKISPYALPSQAYDEYFTPPVPNTHQPYRLTDGSLVPGVTTVLNILDKGEDLQRWIWVCGKQGLDYRDIRDEAARVGTIAHYLIACHLKGEKADVAGYSPDEVDKAEICLAKYLAWEKQNPLTPVMVEEPLISELFKYGGTPDLLAEINGEFVLIDFKTGGRIYDSYFAQLAGYRQLLTEQGWPVAGARILRISPDDGQREVGIQLDFGRDWQIFQHALAIWQLQGGNQ